ncbi:MAG: hypothetical protein CMB80_00030 [Flammeovirgaceae bacterium]|nr:hypothetical protein [Flammeovirgaceae bacterium]
MIEEQVVADVKEPEEVIADVKSEIVDDTQKSSSVPYSRFKEVNEKMKSLETKLAKVTESDTKRRQKRMAEDGKKDELIAELNGTIETLSPYREKLETYETERKQALLANLSEDDRELFGDLPISKLEKIVERQDTKVTPTNAKAGGAIHMQKPLGDMSAEDQRRNWGDIIKNYTTRSK